MAAHRRGEGRGHHAEDPGHALHEPAGGPPQRALRRGRDERVATATTMPTLRQVAIIATARSRAVGSKRTPRNEASRNVAIGSGASRERGAGTLEIAAWRKPGLMWLATGIGPWLFLSPKNHGLLHLSVGAIPAAVGVAHLVYFAAEGRKLERRTEAS